MRTSDRGRALLTQREGVRLKAYKDSVGVWTIGIGHTSMAGPPHVTPGLTITRAECDEIFRRDLRQYEDAVNRAVKVPLQQNEFDALVSFCYNVGTGGMAKSSAVRLLNAGDRQGASDALMKWVKPPEITGRRRSERQQFLTPYTGAVTVPPDVPLPTAPAPKGLPPDKKGRAPTAGGIVVAGGEAARQAWLSGAGPVVIAAIVIIAIAAAVLAWRFWPKGG